MSLCCHTWNHSLPSLHNQLSPHTYCVVQDILVLTVVIVGCHNAMLRIERYCSTYCTCGEIASSCNLVSTKANTCKL